MKIIIMDSSFSCGWFTFYPSKLISYGQLYKCLVDFYSAYPNSTQYICANHDYIYISKAVAHILHKIRDDELDKINFSNTNFNELKRIINYYG